MKTGRPVKINTPELKEIAKKVANKKYLSRFEMESVFYKKTGIVVSHDTLKKYKQQKNREGKVENVL